MATLPDGQCAPSPARLDRLQLVPVLPGLVIAIPLKVYVAGTPIRGFPAALLYGRSCYVLERDPGDIFSLTSVTNRVLLLFIVPPPLD